MELSALRGRGAAGGARNAAGFPVFSQLSAQEARPSRGGDFGSPGHPAPNRGLADFDAELKQFSVDAGRTPQRVGLTHAADQITDFGADLGSSRTA